MFLWQLFYKTGHRSHYKRSVTARWMCDGGKCASINNKTNEKNQASVISLPIFHLFIYSPISHLFICAPNSHLFKCAPNSHMFICAPISHLFICAPNSHLLSLHPAPPVFVFWLHQRVRSTRPQTGERVREHNWLVESCTIVPRGLNNFIKLEINLTSWPKIFYHLSIYISSLFRTNYQIGIDNIYP
jgi:hypothetical protein